VVGSPALEAPALAAALAAAESAAETSLAATVAALLAPEAALEAAAVPATRRSTIPWGPVAAAHRGAVPTGGTSVATGWRTVAAGPAIAAAIPGIIASAGATVTFAAACGQTQGLLLGYLAIFATARGRKPLLCKELLLARCVDKLGVAVAARQHLVRHLRKKGGKPEKNPICDLVLSQE